MHCNACIKYDNCDEFLIYRNRKHESIFYIPHSRRSDKRAYSPKPKENRFLTAKQISFNDFFLHPSPISRCIDISIYLTFILFIVFKHKSHLYEVPIFLPLLQVHTFECSMYRKFQ